MLSNFLKIAMRNLSRQKTLAFINIFGLSIGIACFALLLLYTLNELTFDRFHENQKNIYAVFEQSTASNGDDQFDVTTAYPLAPTLKKDFADVTGFVRVRRAFDEMLVHYDDQSRHLKVSLADQQFFQFFSFPLESGDAKTALQNPNSIVLSSSKAREFFGSENPVGKTINLKVGQKFRPFVITAIAADQPANSSIRFDAMASLDFMLTTPMGEMMNHWYVSSFRTYVSLRPGSRLPAEPGKLEAFHHQYNDDGSDPTRKIKKLITYDMIPLRSMHTDSRANGMAEVSSVDPKTIWIVLAIAVAVLLIGCINFTTLAIGRSAGRGKEVGVRKVAGAGKRQLVFQFLAEAFLLSLLSTIVGLLIAKILLPPFSSLSGRELSFSFRTYPELAFLFAGLILVVAILSGTYPALLLSNFKPVEVLKNKVRMGGSNFFTRSLVTLQFAISFALIISTIIILLQTSHMRNTYPGFDKENVLVIDAADARKQQLPVFKQDLLAQNAIAGVSVAGAALGEGADIDKHGFMYRKVHKHVSEYSVDADYIKVLNMQLVAGRNFDPAIGSDTTDAVIINEAMMNDFGWKVENVIGQKLEGYTNSFAPTVIGVVKNFNYRSLTEKIEPQLFHQFPDERGKVIFVKLKKGNPDKAIAAIQKAWTGFVPEAPFSFSFLDENLDNYYRSEKRWSQIIGWSGAISILLACLGLFGLTALAAVNRVKEIGIRKVLGASVGNIVGLLSGNFLKLIVLAIVIATPLVWYFMSSWLESFAYRIAINGWVFVLCGAAVMLIAFLTISIQALKTAHRNPVKSLRES